MSNYVYVVWGDDSKYRESAIRSIWSTEPAAEKALFADRENPDWDGWIFVIRTIPLDWEG